MHRLSAQNNFVYLFAALVVLLFSVTVLKYVNQAYIHSILQWIIVMVLFVDIRSLHHQRSVKWAGYILIGIFILVYLSDSLLDISISITVDLVIFALFFVYSFIFSSKQILLSKSIDWNMIVGSAVLYLQLGLIWTFIYLFILSFDPLAFSGIEFHNWKESFGQMIYYSFITLTTVGYGDIIPKNPFAEFFSYFEAIIGTLYIAVIVSSLVSARMADYKKTN